jgi:hypothetical protein
MTSYEQPVGKMAYQKHKCISDFQDSTSVKCQKHNDHFLTVTFITKLSLQAINQQCNANISQCLQENIVR